MFVAILAATKTKLGIMPMWRKRLAQGPCKSQVKSSNLFIGLVYKKENMVGISIYRNRFSIKTLLPKYNSFYNCILPQEMIEVTDFFLVSNNPE